jgi:hypothetical protein
LAEGDAGAGSRERRRRVDEPLDGERQNLVELAVLEEADDGCKLAVEVGLVGPAADWLVAS